MILPSSVSGFVAGRGVCGWGISAMAVFSVGRWLRRRRACWSMRCSGGSPSSVVAGGAVWAAQSAFTHVCYVGSPSARRVCLRAAWDSACVRGWVGRGFWRRQCDRCGGGLRIALVRTPHDVRVSPRTRVWPQGNTCCRPYAPSASCAGVVVRADWC